jgi:hypothetical protein
LVWASRPNRRQPLSLRKHIAGPHLQAAQDSMQLGQRDALLAVFEAEERGRRQARLAGELGISHLTPPLAEEGGKLPVQ